MLVEIPRVLPQQSNILLNPQRELHLLVVQNHLTLAAWPVSGISSRQVVFQKMLKEYTVPPGEEAQQNLLNQHREYGSAGVIQGKLINITEYLMSLFQKGREYSTINTNHSMLSVTLPPVDGSVIGKHPIICRFMQGIFNSRPPKPRYSFVWDLNTVISSMDTMPPNEKLSLKDLSAKLVMLMALCNTSKSSNLITLDLNFRQYTSAGVSFTIPGLTKTRRAGQSILSTYPSFPEIAKLCPVTTLQQYEDRTASFRAKNSKDNPLFLSYCKPFKPVGSATIARWLKYFLQLAGIDTTAFKAHSTRAAATSAAHVAGVSVADIMKATDWMRESTFRRFYHRSVQHHNFGHSILSSSK